MTAPDFQGTSIHLDPFPNFRVPNVLAAETAEAVIEWLDGPARLSLRTADFYEQHELSLLHVDLPPEIACLRSPSFIAAVARSFSDFLGAPPLEVVDVCIHRLTPGQTIRIHNDHIGEAETHRLVVQLNRGWTVDQGGLLMLFRRDDPESVTDVLLPVNRSGFGFEISDRSHHAVSTIRDGARDSIVYTFRMAA